MITLNIDTKGLSETEVQQAINSYISNRNAVAWRQEYEAKRRIRIKQNRTLQGQRLRLVNAIKRCGLTVRTQESWRYGQVDVSRTPSEDGWYTLTFHISQPRVTTPESEADYQRTLASYISKLQNSPKIEVSIDTVLEPAPFYAEDKTPSLVTKYHARLINQPEEV